ncbi:DUF4238 domain-containing protein [Komagataeibacter sp. FXV3]|uniref:DUF4238 domain-containing protein n=1 Tax=Komagataeibacter sp. FXV3 TaxID=2608998 RepID=UPI00187B4251|nr:DUF4238 domain-containing protein [Komagataeibacter sp. FXV3]MBE7728250.1 DUF4238 domain-containing protein [Komagataeibacter sp. FXV3]
MAAPRKHHFIPAFYLAQWAASNDQLIEWSKPFGSVKPIRRHPNATGFQEDLYTFQSLAPEARQWFEQTFLKDTDDLASQALKEIMKGRLDALSIRQKSAWVRFIMSLELRHPDVVSEIRETIEVLWNKHDWFTKAAYEAARSPIDPLTFNDYLDKSSPDGQTRAQVDLLVRFMDNLTIGRRIIGMPWAVLDVSTSVEHLLTSDWPVDLALGGTPASVTLPISPTMLFMACADESIFEAISRSNQTEIVRTINEYVVSHARRYVFSSDETQESLIKNRMSSSMVKPPFFPSFYAAVHR